MISAKPYLFRYKYGTMKKIIHSAEETRMNPTDPLPDICTKKKTDTWLFLAYVLLAAVLSTIALCALSAMVIRGIDDVIPHAASVMELDADTALTLESIFAQLDHAELSVHHEVPAFLSLLFSLCTGLMLRTKKGSRTFPLIVTAAFLFGIVFALFSLTASVWMTDVNDIRFGDAAVSLAEMLRNGAADIF